MIRKALIAFAAIAALLVWKIWSDTMSDPVIERLVLVSDALSAAAKPITIAFIADIHMAGPDMPPERVERIVDQTNSLVADIIAVAGDLVSEKRTGTRHYSLAEVIAPLSRLAARDGVVLVRAATITGRAGPSFFASWSDFPTSR